MHLYIEKLKDFISVHPVRYGDEIGSLLELLTHWYLEANPIESAVIHYQFNELNYVLTRLTIPENDRVFDLTCSLCMEHARRAFSEGLDTGIRLALGVFDHRT